MKEKPIKSTKKSLKVKVEKLEKLTKKGKKSKKSKKSLKSSKVVLKDSNLKNENEDDMVFNFKLKKKSNKKSK